MTEQLRFDFNGHSDSPAEFALWLGFVLMADRVPLGEAIERLTAVKRRGAGKQSSINKVASIWDQFRRYAIASGVDFVDELHPEVLSGFVSAPKRGSDGRFSEVSARTSATRASVLRVLVAMLTELGLQTGNLCPVEAVPRGSASAARPATPNELEQVRVHAEPGFAVGLRSAIIALRLTGGSARDVVQVRPEDVDLVAGTVKFQDRTNELDDWSYQCLRQVVATTVPGLPLCVTTALTGNTTWIDRAAQSITVRTCSILREAGLRDLTPTSIERGAARQRHGDDLIAAARFLGASSLDATARNLQMQWDQ